MVTRTAPPPAALDLRMATSSCTCHRRSHLAPSLIRSIRFFTRPSSGSGAVSPRAPGAGAGGEIPTSSRVAPRDLRAAHRLALRSAADVAGEVALLLLLFSTRLPGRLLPLDLPLESHLISVVEELAHQLAQGREPFAEASR